MTNTELGKLENQSAMERGLLDLSVTLSTRNITAGNQFAIFVLVKNPFDKPVWVRQVHVSLPSELKLAVNSENQKQREKDDIKNKSQKIKEEQILNLETTLANLNTKFNKILEKIDNKDSSDQNTKELLSKIESQMFEVENKIKRIKNESQTNIKFMNDSQIGNLKIVANQANVSFADEFRAGHIEFYDPDSYQQIFAQGGTIGLESSLPKNVALQPGSTVVYTAILYVERSLVFTPSHYRLQFNVNYSFHAKQYSSSTEEQEQYDAQEKIFTNTAAHELSIRPSVYSLITGAGLGGMTGAVARLLQITPPAKWQTLSSIDIFASSVTITVAVILSGIAVIFMARKSEAQSFVSVEDFWGRLLIGFLVGYTGTSFFEQLTGITNPTPINPNPQFSPK